MKMTGICGDNCSSCPRYLATQSGTSRDLEKVKDLWVRLGFRELDFPAKDMICHGCKPESEREREAGRTGPLCRGMDIEDPRPKSAYGIEESHAR